jgi:alpha-1,3-rhamnosyl/mannosyltransferase
MRIAIDATPLLLASAGVKSYLYHWIEALRAEVGEHRVDTIPAFESLPPLTHERSIARPWRSLRGIALLHAANRIPGFDPGWLAPRAGLVHLTNQIRRLPRRCRATATLHDLTSWIYPEFHTAATVRADKEFAARVWARAAGLIAVSEHTRQDAIRLLGLPPERITTIHSGVPEAYFNAVPTPRARHYVLSLGTLEPRKNLGLLLDAWGALPAGVRAEFDLLVAGPAGWGTGALAERLRREAQVAGYVPEAELPGLIAGATALAYPSLYEGFGFPVAQAMAAGAAVVTSNASALAEVTGGAALLVDPRSEAELSRALLDVLTSPSLRARLQALGRARAAQFRWERCARESLRFFERIY